MAHTFSIFTPQNFRELFGRRGFSEKLVWVLPIPRGRLRGSYSY